MKRYEELYAHNKNAEQRLNHRENCFIRKSAKEPKHIAKKKLKEFEPNVKYGIHSHPLPHFSKHKKAWWKTGRGY